MARLGMLAGIVAALWQTPTAEVVIDGRATHYAPGVMAEVVRNRGVSLEGYAGAVALNRRGDLFRQVWLEWQGGPHDGVVDGPFLVADCARRGADFYAREEAEPPLVVEVSAGWAGTRDFYSWGPVPVRVWFLDPARLGDVR